MNWQKDYGLTEGPLGFPMQDRVARAVDSILKQLPTTDDYAYRKVVTAPATAELLSGERADVSWISTESPDRDKEVVMAKGMNDSQFALNPLVTLNHSYWSPPVGRSLWRKKTSDGDKKGVKAKTKYPDRPASLPKNEQGKDQVWPPDQVLALIQAQLLNGKSIGFLPLKKHVPDEKEYARMGWKYDTVKCVLDEWLLLEYACVYLPCNQDALVEAVSKGEGLHPDLEQALNLSLPSGASPPAVLPYTGWDEVERIVQSQLSGLNLGQIAKECVESALDRIRGRV